MRIPEGYKLVPIEPNDAMQLAGAESVSFETTAIKKIWTANKTYRAMIAAAPDVATASGLEQAAIYQVLDPIEGGWRDGPRSLYDATDGAFRRVVYAAPALEQAPLNGIPATFAHDEGAIARCSYCGRYSLDPNTLGDRQPKCECGEKHGWSGSFQKPGPDAKWSGSAPAKPL